MKYRVLVAVSAVVTLTLLTGAMFTPSDAKAQSSRMERQHHQSEYVES